MTSNSEIAIRAENLGKRYLIPNKNQQGGTWSKYASHFKEYFVHTANEDDYFWALKEVDLEVKRGEILGIVGRNGSGKSTLLKILSGVVQPTTGRAELQGRIGSLLEVGTGFHPDLSGRENVFMSGALLGIPQTTIKAKFDEIVDYSGIEQFIDVPVKRYSSGMYVRLAFAVTSLLQSDILILDEVMAVGDAGFREKSQNRIEQMANDGRTILFVSHNIQAIRSICKSGIMLSGGRIEKEGSITEVSTHYLRHVSAFSTQGKIVRDMDPFVPLTDHPGFEDDRKQRIITSIETRDRNGQPSRLFKSGDPLTIRIGYENLDHTNDPYFSLLFSNDAGERIMMLHTSHQSGRHHLAPSGVVECRIDDLRLVSGIYGISIDTGINLSPVRASSRDAVRNATQIEVDVADYLGDRGLSANQGYLAQKSRWQMTADSESTYQIAG